MSPLARSLLTLAALLAAADAVIEVINILEPPGSLCRGFQARQYNDSYFGVTTVITESRTYRSEQVHEIKDNCHPLNLTIASQLVKGCNGFHNPSAPNWFPPEVHAIGEVFSPIYASCEGRAECLPIVFEVTQKCISLPQNLRYGK